MSSLRVAKARAGAGCVDCHRPRDRHPLAGNENSCNLGYWKGRRAFLQIADATSENGRASLGEVPCTREACVLTDPRGRSDILNRVFECVHADFAILMKCLEANDLKASGRGVMPHVADC